jgi:hypothetical protein
MSVAETYAAMTATERTTIQTDLVWTGYYNGLADGDFGERSIAAVRDYQQRSNAKPTGILNPQERIQLAALAKSQQDLVGWRVVDDSTTGVRLGLPTRLVPQATRGKERTRWASPSGDIQIETFRVNDPDTTLASVAAKQRTEADRKIEYDVQRPSFFVLSGEQGGKKFYVRAHGRGEEVRGFTVTYDAAKDQQMQIVIVALSNAFVPFSANTAVVGTDARRKVEYSTGIVVSAAGDILADREATDGCHIIRIADVGPAERSAEDAGAGLALLRLNGVRGLRPAVLAGGSGGGAMTLVGVADPRTQDGGDKITTPAARLTPDGAKLEPTPAAGFSGAAAVGQDGRLRGIVRVGSQASLVPIDAAVQFLRRQGLMVAGHAASLKDVKAAVVRVICVRP